MIQEIALTQLQLSDVILDDIISIGNIPMPSGTKFDDLCQQMPFTFRWVEDTFGVPKPCMLRISPAPVTIVAATNSVPYDVPCSDYSIFSLLGWHRHPDHRPK
jgi:hypothetical protein